MAVVELIFQVASSITAACVGIFQVLFETVLLEIVPTLFSCFVEAFFFIVRFITSTFPEFISDNVGPLSNFVYTILTKLSSLTSSIFGFLYEVALLVFQDFSAVSVLLFDYIKAAFTLGGEALSAFPLDADVVQRTVATWTSFLKVGLRTVFDWISFSLSYLYQAFGYVMTVALAAFQKIQATCSFIFSGVLLNTLREMLFALHVGIDGGTNLLVSIIQMAFKVGGSILILAIALSCILLALNLCFRNVVRSKRAVSSICKTFTCVLMGVISLVFAALKLLVVVPRNHPGVDPVQRNHRRPHQRDTTPDQEPSRNRQRSPQVVPTFGPNDAPSSPVPKTAPTTGSGKNDTNLSDDDRQCIICYDNPKSVMIRPCNHVCLCDVCSRDIRGLNGKCPMCRKDIRGIERVYL